MTFPASHSRSEPKTRFMSEEERLKRKEEFEDIAKILRDEFEKQFVPNRVISDRPGKLKLLNQVDAQVASDYCRKLGSLMNEASAYDWEFDLPKIAAEFKQIQIVGNLRLAKAWLPSLFFNSVTISGESDFTGARFLGYFFSSHTDFSGDAYFNHSAFLRGMSLSSANFSGQAYFSSAEFFGSAAFPQSTFAGDAYFIDASFRDGTQISNVKFQARALFHRAFFSGIKVVLDETIFGAVADFEKAKFLSLSSFRKVVFSKKAGFQDSVFSDKADFSDSIFSDLADFGSAVFSGQARFLDCQFKKQTIFSRSWFALCPRFHEAVLHQDTSFTEAKFDSMALTIRAKRRLFSLPLVGFVVRKLRHTFAGNGTAGKNGDDRINWDAEARAYRTLKLHMSKHQAQPEASRFFAGEMRCRRREFGLKQAVHYLASQLYDLFSEFGQSTGRVLTWMLLINAAFTYCYLVQAEQDTHSGQVRFAIVEQQNESLAITPAARWDRDNTWLALSMQSLNPVAFLSPKNTWVQIYDGALFVQGVSQSLLNLVLLILLAISLRGQFRRGAGGGD